MNIEIQGNIQVKGKVQGVWFRAFTKEKAEELGLTGWVQNQPGGSVYLKVKGKKETIEKLISDLGHGPKRSQVEYVNVEWNSPEHAWSKFEIRY